MIPVTRVFADRRSSGIPLDGDPADRHQAAAIILEMDLNTVCVEAQFDDALSGY